MKTMKTKMPQTGTRAISNEWSEEIEQILAGKGPKKKKKIIRRKPGTKPINYFTEDTQLAIMEFQAEEEGEAKNEIYANRIHPAFSSLVENLINVYGYSVNLESRTDLKNECLEFLFVALPKFKAEKGSKAFSYFNVVARNWLTIKSKQNVKKTQTYISIDNRENISDHDLFTIECYKIALDGEELMINHELRNQVNEILESLGAKVKTENEQNCIGAIEHLLKRIDDVDFLNKRAILLYLRELTGLSSKQLSIVLASLKKHYKEIKKREEYSS